MKKHIVDILLVLLIITIGILIRLPLSHMSTVDTSRLSDPDSYLYLRKATELMSEPISEWEMVISRSDDALINAVDSEDDSIITNFLPILAAFACKGLNLFLSSISIEDVAYYFCAILCPLVAIPVYMFVKKHFNRIGAVVTSLLYCTAFSYSSHTTAGYFDTDAIIMILATIYILLQIELLCETKLKKQILLMCMLFVSVVLFSFAWNMYYVYVLIALAIDFVCIIVSHKDFDKAGIIVPLVADVAAICYCFTSIDSLIDSFVTITSSAINKSIWPDESKYISELAFPVFLGDGINAGFICAKNGFVNWLGGLSLFALYFISFFYAVFLIIKYKKGKKDNQCLKLEQCIILISLVFWSLVVIPIIPMGVRYVQLLALPLSLILGIVFGIYLSSAKNIEPLILRYLLVLLISFNILGALFVANIYVALALSIITLFLLLILKINKAKLLLTMLLSTAILCPIACESLYANTSKPLSSSDYDDACEYINSNTSEDATFVCWWNYGYYFQYMTNRKIVADGGTYNGKYFYWLANVFTSKDEELSSGICEMLSGGSLEALNVLTNVTGDEYKSTNILKEILTETNEEAFNTLTNKYDFSEEKSNEILKYINSSNDVYFILENVDYDMAVPLSYFGLWDLKNGNNTELSLTKNTDGTYVFPDELNGSLLLKMYNEEELNCFDVVYSNDSITLYKVVTD